METFPCSTVERASADSQTVKPCDTRFHLNYCLQCFDAVGWAAGRAWVLAWLSVWSEMQTCIWPSWCHYYSLSLASVKSRLVLPFWYWLTWVVPETGPVNGCVCDQWPSKSTQQTAKLGVSCSKAFKIKNNDPRKHLKQTWHCSEQMVPVVDAATDQRHDRLRSCVCLWQALNTCCEMNIHTVIH